MKIKIILDLINIIKKEYKTIFLATVIFIILNILSLNILYFLLFTGFGYMFIKSKKGEKILIKDIFRYKDKFIFLLILQIIYFFITLLGIIFLIIPGLLIITIWIYSPFYIAYMDKTIMESLKLSAETVIKNDIILHFIIVLILILINLLGIKLIIGNIITIPLTIGFLALLFDEVKIV